MNTKINITKEAFQGLFIYAYGTLKVETTGFLAGEEKNRKTKRDFIAELALAEQQAKRTWKSVELNEKEDRRMEFALNGSRIGGFHSHYNSIPVLSEADFDVIRNYYKNGIEVLVSLDRVKRMTKVITNPFFISGCFSDRGKKYRMGFRCYYLDFGGKGEIGHPRRAEIKIPKKTLKEYF